MLYYNAIKILIYATPFIDSFNGLAMSVGGAVIFGQIIRVPIIVGMILLLGKINFRYFMISLFALAVFLTKDVVFSGVFVSDVVTSITIDFRYLYVLVFCQLLISCYKKGIISTDDLLVWGKKAVLIFAVIIILSKISGVGLNYAGANKGLFIEVNALTALLVWGVSIWLYPLYFTKFTRIDLCGGVLMVLATGSQATKTGLLGVCIVMLYYGVVKAVKRKNARALISTLMLVIIGCFGVYFYLASELGATVLSRWQYFMARMDFFTFLVSGRNIALQVAFSEWSSDILYILCGFGYSIGAKLTFGHNPTLSYGGPEMDLLDIGFFYGIIAMCVVTYYTVKPIVHYTFAETERSCIVFSYILLWGIMFLGGHVLGSPMAGIFYAVAYVMAMYRGKTVFRK